MTIRIAVARDRSSFTATRVKSVPDKPEDGVFYIERADDLDALPDEVLDAAYRATHSSEMAVADRTDARAQWWQSFAALSHRNGSVVQMTDEQSSTEQTETTQDTTTTEQTGDPAATTQENQTMPATATKTRKVTKKATKANGKPKADREPKGFNYEPGNKSDVKPVREGSMIARLVDLLERGATPEAVDKIASEGKGQGIRMWLGYLSRVYGYGVRQEGNKLYLVLPKGMTERPAHKPLKGESKEAKKAEKKAKKGSK